MITIKTAALADLLSDLVLTAHEAHGVHVRTVRGYWGSEPGEVTLFVGTSTDGAVLGHTWTYVEGSLDPLVWSVADCRAVIALARPLAASDKNHTLDISLGDKTVVIRETPGLFGADKQFQFDGQGAEDFPIARLARILSGDPLPVPVGDDTLPLADAPRTTFVHAALEPLIKIAKRRKEQIHIFRTHNLQVHRVQIGSRWIGGVSPSRAFEHDDPDKPNVESNFGDSIPVEHVTDSDEDWLKKLGILLPENAPAAEPVEDEPELFPASTEDNSDSESGDE